MSREIIKKIKMEIEKDEISEEEKQKIIQELNRLGYDAEDFFNPYVGFETSTIVKVKNNGEIRVRIKRKGNEKKYKISIDTSTLHTDLQGLERATFLTSGVVYSTGKILSKYGFKEVR